LNALGEHDVGLVADRFGGRARLRPSERSVGGAQHSPALHEARKPPKTEVATPPAAR
jgi:hypothetical protein